jgi:hypothetical protein
VARTEHFTKVVLVLALLVFASAGAFAKNLRTLTLNSAATLNGTPVAAGEYSVNWQTHSPEATVTLTGRNANRVTTTVEGRWEERNTKYESDAVVTDKRSDGSLAIIEIRFAGLRGALVFGKSSQ